jgi:hypothetical protein
VIHFPFDFAGWIHIPVPSLLVHRAVMACQIGVRVFPLGRKRGKKSTREQGKTVQRRRHAVDVAKEKNRISCVQIAANQIAAECRNSAPAFMTKLGLNAVCVPREKAKRKKRRLDFLEFGTAIARNCGST